MKIVNQLYRFKLLRRIARSISKHITIGQPFYNGKIYLNALEHKWAYLNGMSFEKHDHDLQQQIFGMAKNCGLFIDIGCNVGVMTIGVLLHHQQLKAIALDPSQTAVKLVKRSVKANKLCDRCTVVNAAVGDADGTAHFTDSLGNAMAAVQGAGDIVKQLSLSNILNAYPDIKKLVKIDTEGFETVILKDLDNVKNKQDVTFIIEVHNLGYNNGNPSQVFSMLKKQDAAIIKGLNGEEITSLPDGEISQILVSF